MNSQCVLGFHANDKKRCERFVSDESFLIVCNDDIEFLGTGMYFWEHKSDADWWMKEKKKEVEVQAYLCLDNMLDLTEIATVERIFRLFDRIDKAKYYEAKKDLLKYGKDISLCPGAKLDVLFDTWSDFSEICVIKGRQRTTQESLYFRETRLTVMGRDMYCVRNCSVPTERSLCV